MASVVATCDVGFVLHDDDSCRGLFRAPVVQSLAILVEQRHIARAFVGEQELPIRGNGYVGRVHRTEWSAHLGCT